MYVATTMMFMYTVLSMNIIFLLLHILLYTYTILFYFILFYFSLLYYMYTLTAASIRARIYLVQIECFSLLLFSNYSII